MIRYWLIKLTFINSAGAIVQSKLHMRNIIRCCILACISKFILSKMWCSNKSSTLLCLTRFGSSQPTRWLWYLLLAMMAHSMGKKRQIIRFGQYSQHIYWYRFCLSELWTIQQIRWMLLVLEGLILRTTLPGSHLEEWQHGCVLSFGWHHINAFFRCSCLKRPVRTCLCILIWPKKGRQTPPATEIWRFLASPP